MTVVEAALTWHTLPEGGPVPSDKGPAGAGWVPGMIFEHGCHLSGVYIGYTYFHLPVSKDRPPCPNNPDAIRAIFAARMAFSSF